MSRYTGRNNKWLFSALIIIAVVGGIMAGRLVFNDPALIADFRSLQAYPQAREISEFELLDQFGDRFGKQRLTDRWHLVFFGFTHCPDICPTTLSQLAQVMHGLRNAVPEHLLPRVLLVSVDPERDTPELLARYVTYFDPDFMAATGSDQQLQTLARQLGAIYRIEPHSVGTSNYTVDHSASILLLNPETSLAGQFSAPHDVEAIIADLRLLLEQSGS